MTKAEFPALPWALWMKPWTSSRSWSDLTGEEKISALEPLGALTQPARLLGLPMLEGACCGFNPVGWLSGDRGIARRLGRDGFVPACQQRRLFPLFRKCSSGIFSADGLVRIRAADRNRADPGGDPGAVSQAAHVSRHRLSRRENSEAGTRSLYHGIPARQPPVERGRSRGNGDDRDFPLRRREKGADSGR